MTALASLDDVPLFRELTPKKREALSAMCTIRRYAAGDVVVPVTAEGAVEVAFVLEGEVRVATAKGDGELIVFEDLGVGDCYGALHAIDPRVPLGSVIARTDCRLGILPGTEFLRVLAQNGKAAIALLRRLTERLTEFAERAETAQGERNYVQRIYAELLRLAEPPVEGEKALRVSAMPRHRELADRLETQEENVTAAIAHLLRAGLARRVFPGLELTDPARVRALCDLA